MTPKFFDIFAKKERKVKPKEILKIDIDYREKNSLVPASLKNLGFEIEFKELKVADYLVNNIAIERKTISDFISSMINKRLLRQLEELQQYPNKLLVIEGFDDGELYNDHEASGINPNAIRGFLLSILLRYKIPVVFSKSPEDTAKFIYVLSRKKEKEMSLKAKKRNLNKKEQIQFILEGFAGIGPSTAKKLLEKFKTLEVIFSASPEKLKELIGKKADIFNLLREKY